MILKAKQKLGRTFNSDKLGGKDTKGEEFKTSNEEGADHYSGYPSKS